MELSRPDAVSALRAVGNGSAGVGPSPGIDGSGTRRDPGDSPTRTLVALAEVLYPSAVEVTEQFVETYLFGRLADDTTYHAALVEGIETLDDWARDVFGPPFAALAVEERDRVLREMGIQLVDAVPDGTDLERLRHYLVDELLVAFYTSPTGADLVGADCGLVYDGGVESYNFGLRG